MTPITILIILCAFAFFGWAIVAGGAQRQYYYDEEDDPND